MPAAHHAVPHDVDNDHDHHVVDDHDVVHGVGVQRRVRDLPERRLRMSGRDHSDRQRHLCIAVWAAVREVHRDE
jgi:hypothetical protein